ncbi:2-oxo-4-hydroxy-4-carboxy-5-ureidoimidazoline decarboxylase [Microbacterium sp. ASV81]|uniref:2-oxo-4-hydroxy-4-carboxy-5-ureidoimidazoline decarboxylase n=1 Tax=Microbacterium capsulatum TaxID=3041921 RepID=A0ABU0XCS4_9MICO|nr:2-oxo-4-hydroxy-4-carboxy-5-ureidoimidazoline decarboxylase [Microbacterium sp. ASV81]MDQ4212911.1 2-oxo-4-hydroxy-4-carboxy-5-ureidoimidazoline decarboxylase [Microbacterium sp. ASV81]
MTTAIAAVLSRGLESFNGLPDDEFIDLLTTSCHLPVRAWAVAVDGRRPFADVGSLLETAGASVDLLTDDDVDAAHHGLRRIGSKLEGDSLEDRWSRQESGLVRRDEETWRLLEPAHEGYEAKHGRTFLISATGLSTEQILDALRSRTALTREEENRAAKDELRKLVEVRLRKLLTALGEAVTDGSAAS